MYAAIFMSFVYSLITFFTVKSYLSHEHTLLACFVVGLLTAIGVTYTQDKTNGVPEHFRDFKEIPNLRKIKGGKTESIKH